MKTKIRPPRKKQRWDIPNTAHHALKKAGCPLSLNDLKKAIENITENSNSVTLGVLHTELNLDGRFIFLSDRRWALKSQVPHLRRRPVDDFDIFEEEYQPIRDDYQWHKASADDEDEDVDDESDLLVPYDEDLEEDVELEDEDDAEDEYIEDEDDADDDEPIDPDSKPKKK